MGNANPPRLPLIGPLALPLANQIAQGVHAGSGADGVQDGDPLPCQRPNTGPLHLPASRPIGVRDLSPTASDMANEDVEVGLIGPEASQKEACAAGPAPLSNAEVECSAGPMRRGGRTAGRGLFTSCSGAESRSRLARLNAAARSGCR